MKSKIEELYRNEAILELLRNRDAIYSNENIVDVVKEIDEILPEDEFIYKVSISPIKGVTLDSYIGRDEIRDLLAANGMLEDIEDNIIKAVELKNADKINQIKANLGTL